MLVYSYYYIMPHEYIYIFIYFNFLAIQLSYKDQVGLKELYQNLVKCNYKK